MVPLAGCGKTTWARENFDGSDRWHSGKTPDRMLKKAVQQGRNEPKPKAYPLGRTVRRIRSTTSVRAAESVRRPGLR